MKKIIFFSTILLALFSSVSAQQQWKFYVAFEDATMARDTIWFVWDTTATFEGADTLLNEVSAVFNYDEFNVWTYNHGLFFPDSVKTIAHPFNESFGHSIDAMNFELPIKITWDSSLFHASWLPPSPVGWVNAAGISNDYFFNINNVEVGGFFDMTLADSIIAPEPTNPDPWFWNPGVHFPMGIGMSQDPTLGLNYRASNSLYKLNAFPNPFFNSIKFKIESPTSTEPLKIRVIDLYGRPLYETEFFRVDDSFQATYIYELEKILNVAPSGFYIATLQSNKSIVNSIKIVKLKK